MLDLYRLSEFCMKMFKHGTFSQLPGKKSKFVLSWVTHSCCCSGIVIRVRLKTKSWGEYIDLQEVQRQKHVPHYTYSTEIDNFFFSQNIVNLINRGEQAVKDEKCLQNSAPRTLKGRSLRKYRW
jgi:hypothetical protein